MRPKLHKSHTNATHHLILMLLLHVGVCATNVQTSAFLQKQIGWKLGGIRVFVTVCCSHCKLCIIKFIFVLLCLVLLSLRSMEMAVFRQLTTNLHCRYLLKKTGRENQQNSVLVMFLFMLLFGILIHSSIIM